MKNQTESQLENNIEEIAFTNIIEYIFNKITNLEDDFVLPAFQVELINNLIKIIQDGELDLESANNLVERDDTFDPKMYQ
ncbi:19777_t:CDS:2, partial [Racocetra persica]